jgi:hypothetical protein
MGETVVASGQPERVRAVPLPRHLGRPAAGLSTRYSGIEGRGLTDRFRMKFVVKLGGWVFCRQDLLGVC